MVFQHRLLPGATRSPEAARPRQVTTHTAALAIPGERTGVAAILGGREFLASHRRQIIHLYTISFVNDDSSLENAKFLLSSRPQTGIRSPPISGPRPSFVARSRRGYGSPASAGPIPARTLLGSRAAAKQSDPEVRSFCWIFRRRAVKKGSSKPNSKFFFFFFASISVLL